MRYWTREENRRLCELWERGLSDILIAERLGRSPAAIGEHRRVLGLATPYSNGVEVWTAERIAELTTLWNAGASVTKIAQQLGVTRNAVLGKRLRLGLPKRSRSSIDAKRARAALRQKGPGIVEQPCQFLSAMQTETVDLQFGKPIGLTELTERSCRWPLGEPGSVDFGYCGRRTLRSRSFCPAHFERAYLKQDRDDS